MLKSFFQTGNAMSNRLYIKGRILGHKRGKRNSRPNQSLLQIEGVDNKEAAGHYLGKVSGFSRKAQCGVVRAEWDMNGTGFRIVQGR